MSTRRLTALALLTVLFTAAPAFGEGYVGGGTIVAKSSVTGTLVDDGAVVCQGTNGDGIGGGCLPFGATAADEVYIGVRDDEADKAVAFQVCIDNNGDGICGGPQNDPRCFDQIFFSHADGGKFFNPLGPLPTSFLPDCGQGAFPGYVVLLCQGVHEDRQTGPHTHDVSRGVIAFTPGGSGYGDFCGGGGSGGASGKSDAVAKAYKVV